MRAKEVYQYAIDQATAVVVQVEPDQLNLATPDTEWSVRDLLEHMLNELAWTADIVKGKTIAEVGDIYEGDLLGKDAIVSWRSHLRRVQTAVEECDEHAMAHVSYGEVSVAEYLWEAGNDQLVHAWDLGQAIGISVLFDEAVARALYKRALSLNGTLAASGLFGVPVPVPTSANAQTKLLGLLGRSEDWVEAKMRSER